MDVRECGRGQVSGAIFYRSPFRSFGHSDNARGQTVSTQVFFSRAKQVIWKNPVSVLIDATTSGAAEVLASAVVANHRGGRCWRSALVSPLSRSSLRW